MSKLLVACFSGLCAVVSPALLYAQTADDGPVRLEVRVREFNVRYAETDTAFFGVVGQPDDMTFFMAARDGEDVDGTDWLTSTECLQHDGTPPLTSPDFNRVLMDHVYPDTVPLTFDLRLDSWEDESPDQLLGIGCVGNRCSYETGFCCGGILFGTCIGTIDNDDNRAFGDPMVEDVPFRVGEVCEWYDHGFMDSDCCGDLVRPHIESRWSYTRGDSLAEALELGDLPAGGAFSERNSSACYADAQAEVAGAEVVYTFSAAGGRVAEVSVCGLDGFVPDAVALTSAGPVSLATSCATPVEIPMCAGDEVQVLVGSSGAVGSFTLDVQDVATGPQAACCGDGADDVYEVCDDGNTLNTDACVSCQLAACGDGFVQDVVEACDDGALNGQPLSCSAACDGVTVSVCGNGVVEAGEGCDDAGETASCDVDCTIAVCGDGYVNSDAGEVCDDSGNSSACDADCTPSACGDGFVNAAAGETCDDSVVNGEPLRCNVTCDGISVPVCGNGVVEVGERCDDGNTIDTDECIACVLASCGDGILWDGVETCDDGGANGTPLSCNLSCDGTTMATCGNSVVEAGEDCDDGGETGSCDPDCTAVSCGDGYANAAALELCDDGVRNGEPLACDALCAGITGTVCGNGVLEPGEACDGGGETDTCDVDCSPARCGDGTTNATAGEACDTVGFSDTCNADCTDTVCGDGVLNLLAGEICDDGNDDNTDDCVDACEAARCGDGFVRDGVETCDDGPSNGAPGACNLSCGGVTSGTCGNGVVEDGEDCDDGGESDVCDADCTAVSCGDGATNTAAGEVCDDGGDNGAPLGCATDCSGVTPAECGNSTVEDGEVCDDGDDNGAPLGCATDCSGVTPAECGNGTVEDGEVCDDGDDNGAPLGCASDCAGVTAAECGNGAVEAGERCDDGEDNGTPGNCSAACDGVTSGTCGNGAVESGEFCDDGGESAACDVDCTDAVCGDGMINAAAGEACDGGAACGPDCQEVAEDVGTDVAEDVGTDTESDTGDAGMDTGADVGRLQGGGLSCATTGRAPVPLVLLAGLCLVAVRRRR